MGFGTGQESFLACFPIDQNHIRTAPAISTLLVVVAVNISVHDDAIEQVTVFVHVSGLPE
jgi:hypothetical protein